MSKRNKVDKKPLLEETNHGLKHQQDSVEAFHVPSDLTGDWMNILVLFFLYLLQGIPIGLAAGEIFFFFK